MDDATEELPPAAERVEDENGELIALGNVEAAADTDSNSVADDPAMNIDPPASAADDNAEIAIAATVEELELPPPRLMITKMVSKPLATTYCSFYGHLILNNNYCPPPNRHLFRFNAGTRKLQIIRRSKDHRTLPQMLLLRGRSQWIGQIQCHRRHVIRLWETCQETTSQ